MHPIEALRLNPHDSWPVWREKEERGGFVPRSSKSALWALAHRNAVALAERGA